MDATDWLAGLSGGLNEISATRKEDRDTALTREKMRSQEKMADVRAEVQRMLGQIRADTSTGNNVRTNSTREDIAGLTESGRNTRAGQSDATRRRGQDITQATTERGQNLNDDHYWDSADRFYTGLFTRDATQRRGQDMTAGTATANRASRDTNADTALRARNALGVLGLKARKRPSLLDAGPPEDFAAEFDRLYNDPSAAASESLDDQGTGDAAPPRQPTPAPAAARPPVPVSPRTRPGAGGAGASSVGAGTDLESRARNLIDKIRSIEGSGGDATNERNQLAALRAQVR
jgi:hypothetical protein